jgi:hypothetical protein
MILDGSRHQAVERRHAPPRRGARARSRPGRAACFDARYHYWFWRPDQAIPQADIDGNPATVADPTWQPLRTTPNFPEYPSAHACHSTPGRHRAGRVLRH